MTRHSSPARVQRTCAHHPSDVERALARFESQLEARLGLADSEETWWTFVLDLYRDLSAQLGCASQGQFEIAVDALLTHKGYSSLSVVREMRREAEAHRRAGEG